MKRSGLLLVCTALIVVVASLFWVSFHKPKHLTVAIHPWIGYEPLYLARDFNWLPNDITIREDKTLDESLAALRSGQANAACMTLDEMLRARAQGLPLAVALVLDVSAGADKVLSRSEIKTPSDLANKRIGFDPNALGALIFEKLLETAGLTAAAVIQVNLPPARQLEAWRSNQVDAVISYEPMTSILLREGAHNLFDSRQMPDTIIDVLAVRSDQPEVLPLVQVLIIKYFQALDYLHGYYQDSLFRISARETLRPEEVEHMLAGVIFPSLEANRSYLLGGDPRLTRAARSLSTLMVKRGLLLGEDDLSNLIMPNTLPIAD